MSIEIKGQLVNFWWRNSGTSNPFKKMVCTENSSFTYTTEVNKKFTNCGVKGTPAPVEFSASLEAVQNANPGALESNYQDIKTAIIAGQKIDFRYASDPDTTAGIGFGDGIYNFGSGYFSELGAAASAEGGEALTYSMNFDGVGTPDVFDTSS